MNFSTIESFPQTLVCSICFYPPEKPRISICECARIYCLKCARLVNPGECPAYECTNKFEYKLLPKTHKYMLKNIQIKCSACKEYQTALNYKKHESLCQRKREELQKNNNILQFIGECLIFEDRKKYLNPKQICEIEIHNLANIIARCNQCFAQIDGIEVLEHLQYCLLQTVNCQFKNCKWNGKRLEYNDHMKQCSINQLKFNQNELVQYEQAKFLQERNHISMIIEAFYLYRREIILTSINMDIDNTPQQSPNNQQLFEF